jgi:CBS domain-containing protein
MPKARDIMTPNPQTCQETDTIEQAVRIMQSRNTGVIPIVDSDNCCCGIVTDRDICLRVVLNKLDPATTPLKEVISWDLLTCHPDDDIDDVLLRMERKQIKRIPVVDDNDKCVGIISEHDIVIKHDNPQKLAELSKNIYS